MATVQRVSSNVAHGADVGPRKPLSSAQVQQSFRDRQKAKLEQQEAQIRELQGSLRQMELERARQQAELDTLSKFCTGAGAGMASPMSGSGARGGNGAGGDRALEARVLELEQRLARSEAERQLREAQHERDALELQAKLQAVVFDRQTSELHRAKEQAHLHEYYLRSQELTEGSADHRAHVVFELDEQGSQLVAKLLRAVRGPDAVGTTPAECRRITPAALHDIWHEVVARFSVLLENGGDVPGSRAAAQLDHQMHKYHDMLFYMWGRQYQLFIIYHNMLVRGTELNAELLPEEADRILAAMQLEDEQVARICVENEAMVEALNGVYTRQQATLRALSESSLKSVEGMTKHMSELQASGVAAQRAIREYHNKVKQGILRPVQLAKGMIAAYPRVLNTLALGAVLGRRMGRVNDRQDRGMAAVLSWLFNDGSSSAMGRPEPVGGTVDAMSIGSLQDALQAVDDISLDLLPAELDLDDGLGPPDNEQHKQASAGGTDDSGTSTGGPESLLRGKSSAADPVLMQAAQEVLEEPVMV